MKKKKVKICFDIFMTFWLSILIPQNFLPIFLRFFFSNDLSISILFCVTIKTPSQGLSIGSIKLQNSPFSSMVVYREMMHS